MLKIINLIQEKSIFEITTNEFELKIYGVLFSQKTIESISAFIASPESYIKGDYSFTLKTASSFYLGSSRSAVFPLYFRILDGSVIFSNFFNKVVESSTSNKLSSEAAFQFVRFEYITDPLTIVQDVYKVPSANIIKLSTDLSVELIECSPKLSAQKESTQSINDFKESVYDAHKNRISTASMNTLLLSGGVDSCTSAIVLKDILDPNMLQCFNFSTKDAEQDEYPDAKHTADYLGLKLERVIVDPYKETDLKNLVHKSNFFYSGAIDIAAMAEQIGEPTNFFACQDTRLHTPALNALDKFIFSSKPFTRKIFSSSMKLLPSLGNSQSIVNKVIERGRLADDLASYTYKLFFHQHNIELGNYTADTIFNTELKQRLQDTLANSNASSREIYNRIVELAWHGQYSDDIQYLTSTTAIYDSPCQMPWYDADLAMLSAKLPMKEATKFVKGRAGHSSKPKRVNKYLLRHAFQGQLPNSILYRDKAVCVTNHLYLKGCYKPYIEEMNINSKLFNTQAGAELNLSRLFEQHYANYMGYEIKDYNLAVELQNLVALELYCQVYNLG